MLLDKGKRQLKELTQGKPLAKMIAVTSLESKHGRILREKFGEALDDKRLICLRIPDAYRYMEPALIDELKAALTQHVEVPG